MSESTQSPSFEEAYQKLQSLVSQMEKGDLSLEQSLKAFEEGVSMTKVCQEALSAADLKVEQLMKISNEGKVETKKFGE